MEKDGCMPPCLSLEFLGLPQVHLDNKTIATDRRKAIALLAYLAVSDNDRARQRYSRESLSALLWPDYEQAKAFSNLRRTIWEVHQALGEGWLIAERESLQLNEAAQIDLDVARFLDLISQGRQQVDAALRVSLLSDAVKLYRNHFLTGFSLKDAPIFNEWAFVESENLRRQLGEAPRALRSMASSVRQTRHSVSRRLITLDPLNEPRTALNGSLFTGGTTQRSIEAISDVRTNPSQAEFGSTSA
jgi:DNA-binding SARP family transcriptional activator